MWRMNKIRHTAQTIISPYTNLHLEKSPLYKGGDTLLSESSLIEEKIASLYGQISVLCDQDQEGECQ